MIRTRTAPSQRLMKHVTVISEGCWNFLGRKSASGYGSLVDVRSGFRKEALAHRVSWEMHNGSIPAGLHVLHHCDNRICVNPGHLFLGTNADNVRDRTAKGRSARHAGEDNGRAKLTAVQVEDIRKRAPEVGRAALATEYGITRSHISTIANYRAWNS